MFILKARDQKIGEDTPTTREGEDKVIQLLKQDRFTDAQTLCQLLDFEFTYMVAKYHPDFQGKWKVVNKII